MSSGLIRFAFAGFLAFTAAVSCHAAFAQQAPATPAAPAASSPTPAAAGSGADDSIARAGKARSPFRYKSCACHTSAGSPPTTESAPSAEASTGEAVDLPPRAFAYVEGKADKDEIYSSILGSLGVVKREMDKANLAPVGRPIAVFVESDDTGFRYHAGYPLTSAPEGKSSLSETVKIGQTPSGKAMRFEHQGAYGDIDATYDAITAYLDDKGIDAQDTFIEEYVNDVKDPDDPTLQVNIYVLLK